MKKEKALRFLAITFPPYVLPDGFRSACTKLERDDLSLFPRRLIHLRLQNLFEEQEGILLILVKKNSYQPEQFLGI